MSDQCRLKVYRRWGVEYCWIVEFREAGTWKEDSRTGLLLFPFWAPREIVYRQNVFISGPPNIE